MAASKNHDINWWSAFRLFCFVGGLALVMPAYFAPEWTAQFISPETASTVGILLLLLLPATLVLRLGGGRLFDKIRKSGRRVAREKLRSELPRWADQKGLVEMMDTIDDFVHED